MNAENSFPVLLFCPGSDIGALVIEGQAELAVATRRYFSATLVSARELVDSKGAHSDVRAALGPPVPGALGFRFSSGGRPSLLPSRHYTVQWTSKSLGAIALGVLKQKVRAVITGEHNAYWYERLGNEPDLVSRLENAPSVSALIKELS